MDRNRRALLGGIAAALAGIPISLQAEGGGIHCRAIPADGSLLPVVGLGSWITFDVPPDEVQQRENCTRVIQAFFNANGAMIDSSPMYGYSQDVIGQALRALNYPSALFSATKVWIPQSEMGQRQMEHALKIWGVERFDLLHVHNMVSWDSHLRWLRRWRDEGRVRYIGISTSHGRRHAEMEEVIRSQPFDFVQFTYNIDDREAENRLLPLALDHGKAVVINRPFQGGALFPAVRGRSLPDWAAEIDCDTWAQFFLKFVVSHPAVTCAIPATSQVAHLQENMAVLSGRLPTPEMRAEMVHYFEA